MVLKDVTLRTRPEAGKKANLIAIDRARIDVSPLAQLRGELAYSLDLDALDGRIEAAEHAEKARSRTQVETKEIALAQLPGVKDAINLPLAGRLDMALDLDQAEPPQRRGERHPRAGPARAAGSGTARRSSRWRATPCWPRA